MLALIFYYVLFGSIAMALGILMFKFWDRKKSNQSTSVFHDLDWLKPSVEAALADKELSTQEIYDFSDHYIATLKGAFASPTAVKLERLNGVLMAPHNLHDQLWRDMAVRLSATYDSYKIEYGTLIGILAEDAEDPVQLYAGLRLATGFPEASTKLKRLATDIQNSDKIKPALRAAAKLR
jgi:hypothetical protein